MKSTLITMPGTDAEIIKHHEEAVRLLEYAEGRVISTFDDVKLATDDLSILATLKKVMQNKRVELVKPKQDEIKAIQETYKTLMEPVLEADRITRDKMVAYSTEQERIRVEQEEVNRLRMEAAQKEMELNGELSESVNLVEVNPVTPTTVRTNMGTVGMKANWKYRVFDPLAVPREYMVIDNAMLNTIAKTHHDSKQVPGVEFYNDPIIAVRAKVNKVELEG